MIIEDAGEVIPYARKHLVPDPTPQFSPGPLGKASEVKIKLADLWPEPNWVELQDAGIHPQAIAKLFMIYTNIRKSPRGYHWGVASEKWESSYLQSINILRRLFSEVVTLDDAKSLSKRYTAALTVEVKDFSEMPRHINNRYAIYSTGKCNSRKTISNAFCLSPKDELVLKWLVEFGWPTKSWVSKYTFFPLELDDSSWRVAETTRTTYHWYDKEVVSRDEALSQSVRKNAAQHDPKAQLHPANTDSSTPKERKPAFRPKKKNRFSEQRSGPSYRTGDVSSEEFIATFGFRGVQFGNAMSNVERQDWVNHAFDAFHDLTAATSFKPAWLGLRQRNMPGGALGMAFGARGIAGTTAAAHYEIELNVINLTRASGFGSGGHEWLHGLDARIGKSAGSRYFVTQSFNHPDVDQDFYLDGFEKIDARTVNKIKAFSKIINSCTGKHYDSDYYQSSRKLESQRGAKKYWTKPWELFARAGESYIQDKLAMAEIYSPWLVNGTLESDCSQQDREMWPYPKGVERRILYDLFENLFEILRT